MNQNHKKYTLKDLYRCRKVIIAKCKVLGKIIPFCRFHDDDSWEKKFYWNCEVYKDFSEILPELTLKNFIELSIKNDFSLNMTKSKVFWIEASHFYCTTITEKREMNQLIDRMYAERNKLSKQPRKPRKEKTT